MEFKILCIRDGVKQTYRCCENIVIEITGTVLLMYERYEDPHALGGDWASVPLWKIKGLPR